MIRLATQEDLNALIDIFNHARKFMQENGNPNQWINGYPSSQIISEEINQKHCYVYQKEDGEILATFCFIQGEDPTYLLIENGSWLNNDPYYVIHRLATAGKQKGMAKLCFDWCFSQCNNIRVDTHEDNKVMQHVLEKYGFIRCGIIYHHNGTPRIAYQKTLPKK
mgnify:CR=1 FL=1